MIRAPLNRAWESWSSDFQAAVGRVILICCELERILAFAAHHLQDANPGQDELTHYAHKQVDPLRANSKIVREKAGAFIGTIEADQLADRIDALAIARNGVVHGTLGPEGAGWDISMFTRPAKNAAWDRRMETLPGTATDLDDLAAEAGNIAEEVAELAAKASGLREA